MKQEKEVLNLSAKELVIRESFADKKGRVESSDNPFTCYINISSPMPDIKSLTASMLEVLMDDVSSAYVWALNWDKSIVSVSTGSGSFCNLLPTGDKRGKSFVPVSTTRTMDGSGLLMDFPEGRLGLLAINDQPQTIDAFLISYFHILNELIWDLALTKSIVPKPSKINYSDALNQVASEGFSACILPEGEIIAIKQNRPETSIRVYGSQVNKFVPQILGAVIR